jgi:hypothetical protein
VRDEQERRLGLVDDPVQLDLEPLPRDRVERAERLVHQQERGVERERAGDRDALLHPARELVWVAGGRVPEVGELEVVACPLLRLRTSAPVDA